jgi:hypothetical protein
MKDDIIMNQLEKDILNMTMQKIASYTQEKTASISDYVDIISGLIPSDAGKKLMMNMSVGAGTGALANMISQPSSERDMLNAALRGALMGGLTTPVTMYGGMGTNAGVAALGGAIKGFTTPTMTDDFIADEKRLEDINRSLKSPFLSSGARASLQDEIDAIMEKRQEDIQSKFGSYRNKNIQNS